VALSITGSVSYPYSSGQDPGIFLNRIRIPAMLKTDPVRTHKQTQGFYDNNLKINVEKSVLGIMLIRIRLSILMPIPDPDPDHSSSFTLARNHNFLLLSFTVLPVNIFFFLVSIIGFIIFHNLDSTGRSEILWKK